MLIHQRDLQRLNEGLSTKFMEDLEIPEFRPYLLAHFRTVSRFFYTYSFSVAMNVVFYALIPLTLLRHGKYMRIYPQILPFTYEPGGLFHWSMYAFELLCGFFLWSATCGTDSCLGYYALHMVGELRLLSFRFQNLKSSTKYKRDLKNCIDRHTELVQSQHILEEIFGFLAIWLAITCAVVLCALIFQATETKNLTLLKVCYLICYSFLKLVQAFSYAWFGNIIAAESRACLDSVYDAQWPGSGDTKFMNDVLIILLQKPQVFKAKGVMFLELDMFSKIVNASVSYFFLLQTLEESLDVTS